MGGLFKPSLSITGKTCCTIGNDFICAVKLFMCSTYWPLKESPVAECSLAIGFMHFPECSMPSGQGLCTEGQLLSIFEISG